MKNAPQGKAKFLVLYLLSITLNYIHTAFISDSAQVQHGCNMLFVLALKVTHSAHPMLPNSARGALYRLRPPSG